MRSLIPAFRKADGAARGPAALVERLRKTGSGWRPRRDVRETVADLDEPSLRCAGGREYWKLYRHSPGRIGRKVFPLNPRRSRFRRRLRRAAIVVAICGGLAFLPTWAIRAAGYGDPFLAAWDGLMTVTGKAGLSVREITVIGRDRTRAEDIMAALDAERGTPILTVDPAGAKQRLEALPWVGEAAVERRLPDALHVELTEREPLALWQRDGAVTLIDRTGAVIDVPDVIAFRHLPLVVGVGAAEHAPGLLAMMQQPAALANRVTAAIRVGNRRWNLRLDDRVDVRLPERDARDAWERLTILVRDEGLLDKAVSEIDMRVSGQLILLPDDGAPGAASHPANLGPDMPAIPLPRPPRASQQALQAE